MFAYSMCWWRWLEMPCCTYMTWRPAMRQCRASRHAWETCFGTIECSPCAHQHEILTVDWNKYNDCMVVT
eukprot:3137106-Amphidinium_carterae.1